MLLESKGIPDAPIAAEGTWRDTGGLGFPLEST